MGDCRPCAARAKAARQQRNAVPDAAAAVTAAAAPRYEVTLASGEKVGPFTSYIEARRTARERGGRLRTLR